MTRLFLASLILAGTSISVLTSADAREVRDHRTGGAIVRDHRTNQPIVRDHRTPRIRTDKAPGGVVVTSQPRHIPCLGNLC